MRRVGLVLGAGGVVGQAYHSGVLAVLEHDFGFDARAAAMIVGTSAGSITGTLLRLGVSAEDLAAWTVKAPLSGDGDAIRYLAETAVPDLAPFRLRPLLRGPMRLPGPHMVQRALARPLQFRPLAAAMALLPAGEHDILEQLAALRELERPEWPEHPLWVCAVPGYFAPVKIGGRSYVDGGVHSPTNAAVLRGWGLDLVIVVSPMSGPAGWRPGFYNAARRHSARVLAREITALEADGVRTVVFAPSEEEQEAMGDDMMSRDRLNEIIQQSFFAAGAHAATPAVSDLLRRAAGG